MVSVDALAGVFPASRPGEDDAAEALTARVALSLPTCVLGMPGVAIPLFACASAGGEGDAPGCRQGNTGTFYWRGASEGLLRALFSADAVDVGDDCGEHPSHALARAENVLEIGAGLGGAGIGVAIGLAEAARKRAKPVRVVITDGSAEVVAASQRNVDEVLRDESNAATDHLRAAVAEGSMDVTCETLLWGLVNHDALFERHPDAFDIIVGCDIVYNNDHLPMLFATIHRLLTTRRERSANANPLAVVAFRDRSRHSPLHPNLDNVIAAALASRKGGLCAEVLAGDYRGSEAAYEGAAGDCEIIVFTLAA